MKYRIVEYPLKEFGLSFDIARFLSLKKVLWVCLVVIVGWKFIFNGGGLFMSYVSLGFTGLVGAIVYSKFRITYEVDEHGFSYKKGGKSRRLNFENVRIYHFEKIDDKRRNLVIEEWGKGFGDAHILHLYRIRDEDLDFLMGSMKVACTNAVGTVPNIFLGSRKSGKANSWVSKLLH